MFNPCCWDLSEKITSSLYTVLLCFQKRKHNSIDGVVVKKLQFKFPLIYCRLRVSSKLFIYSITYPSVWKMNPCLSLRCVFLFRMESADSWVWLQMRTAMQVTDIDSGTSLSIQALEQRGFFGFFFAEEKCFWGARTISREAWDANPRHWATRLRENSILFVFLSSACMASHIQLCFFREDFSLNCMTNVVWWCVSIATE